MSNMANDNLILKFAELLAFRSKPAKKKPQTQKSQRPDMGCCLRVAVRPFAGPGTSMWQYPCFIATSETPILMQKGGLCKIYTILLEIMECFRYNVF